MAEVQLKRKITLRRKEKPAEFTFDGLLKVKLLWQSKTDLDLCIFFKRKDGQNNESGRKKGQFHRRIWTDDPGK